MPWRSHGEGSGGAVGLWSDVCRACCGDRGPGSGGTGGRRSAERTERQPVAHHRDGQEDQDVRQEQDTADHAGRHSQRQQRRHVPLL